MLTQGRALRLTQFVQPAGTALGLLSLQGVRRGGAGEGQRGTGQQQGEEGETCSPPYPTRVHAFRVYEQGEERVTHYPTLLTYRVPVLINKQINHYRMII